jgi:hypothetical protein
MLSLLLLLPTAEAKKPKTPPPPPVGWYHEEGWAGDCYNPKDFAAMTELDRRSYRTTVLSDMTSQWRGSRDDGVSMDVVMIDELESVLLAKPTNIDSIAVENARQCVAFRKGGELAAWENYLRTLKPQLTAGDCAHPLTYTKFDYLDIGKGWQMETPMCKGNKAHISGTTQDKYRITDAGPWITVAGDPAVRSIEAQYPCNADEKCFAGMLLGRFVTEAGVEVIFPIGAETTFTAPENGTLTVSINDYQWYDNRYFKTAQIEDRTAITVEPGQ